MNNQDIRSIMKEVPGSYDDFVSIMTGWMDSDDEIKSAILRQIEKDPMSDTDVLAKILWDHLGIGEPVDFVEDADEEMLITA